MNSMRRTLAAAFVLGLTATGCGPADGLATVTGHVTLDGAPLPDAQVQFLCSGTNAGSSAGRTDSAGNYEVWFSRSEKGARIGPSKVSITTFDLDGRHGGVKRIDEKVPVTYNEKTELTADVKPGKNMFNFDLKSEGKLPKAPPKREDL